MLEIIHVKDHHAVVYNTWYCHAVDHHAGDQHVESHHAKHRPADPDDPDSDYLHQIDAESATIVHEKIISDNWDVRINICVCFFTAEKIPEDRWPPWQEGGRKEYIPNSLMA